PWWKRIWVWLIIIIIASPIVADVALRLSVGLGTPLLYRSDPDAGYIVAPSQNVYRLFCHNDINQFSMRSPAVQTPKPKGEYRILFVGDSVTYGTTFVDQPEIFTSLLDQQLPNLLHRPVEVLNASAGGWAVGNELGYLRTRGTFDSNIVFFVINTGDLTQPFAESPVDLSPGFPSHDPTCALSELFERYLLPRLRHQSVADPGSTATTQPDIAHETPDVLNMLGKADKIAIDAGAKFTIVYTPAVGPDWAGLGPALKMLEDWCKSHSIDLINIAPLVSDLPEDQIYFPAGHIHFRPKGHVIIAKAIADYLQRTLREKSTARPATQPAGSSLH
ncbi:MAG TPA: SGNH/GDSL hydrolase family protein, partial [Tepidisphaeraceae bacterium]|nr:SGNH/GDSL hydrolase family protein [Tepidisphaeraceae bacterium]